MPQHIEINPVSHLTIGTIGEPGKRVFYIQGGNAQEYISVIIEKAQASMLADSFDEILDQIKKNHPSIEKELAQSLQFDFRLQEPLTPLFRVGNLGLGYNSEINRVILVTYELVGEDEESNIVSFWTTPALIKALVVHIRQTIKGGRPICGNCGQPIDKDGHFCAHRNGYKA